MPVDCQRSTSGGKGNLGMFMERYPKICAAGLPTAQPDDKVPDALQHYLLKDEADALIADAVIPPKPPRPLPPLRHPLPLDKRNAGPFCNVAQLLNPPSITNFKAITEDIKNTVYSSYWKQGLGQVRDPTPMLPDGFDAEGTTFGVKTTSDLSLYDLVMPKVPLPDNTAHKEPAVQTDRNYCSPAFDPTLTYGHRTNVDKRGRYARCSLTDDDVKIGTGGRTVVNSRLADYQTVTAPRFGLKLSHLSNIATIPEGYAFGKLRRPDNLPECLTTARLNPDKAHFRKCFTHLNKLRKVLSTRYSPMFFTKLYLGIKFFDKDQTGWLPKNVVYEYCGSKYIRFDPSLLEPLLSRWKAFDGENIEYKTFVRVINYRIPSPEPPKIPDFLDDCLDFKTTYTEMTKGYPEDCSPTAGLPSGRYFDLDHPITPEGCIKAVRVCLPHESDVKACLSPSVMTQIGVSHREMYAKRDADVVRRVFEKSGEEFTDDSFNEIWEEAKKYHSEGWVSFETFRRALEKKRPST